ncbi:MAG TPA: hypothetical protein PK413_08285, partial [Thermoanaerobaculia bacterium]|nr:hypothetical protein [Thermoanaerobaculia bacterium]
MDEDAPPADLTVPFNRAWTGSREHGVLSGQLAAADPEAWVRLALPLVRAVASVPGEILSASALTAVADGFLLSVPGPGPPWFVQFLHFAEPGDRLGELHLEVCQASVRKLTESRVSASRYLLIHNSDHRNPAFRQGLETAVSEPVRAGRVERAEVWDRQRLLREAFNAMASHVLASARAGALSVASVEQALVGEPLSEVPLQQSLLTANQHKLLSEAPMGGPAVVDPAAVIFDEAKENISLLLGTFGFGKTTAIARRLRDRSSQVLFVPGGRLTGDIRSTKDFVSQCIALDSLLGDESHLDRLLLERVARPTALLLFKDESLPLVLVLDALDESAFLCRQGGLLALFNNLREVRIPVVLAMRQEFWLSRRLELEESFGMLATKTPDRISRIRAVELLPWQDDQILACLSRARELVTAEEERQRLP